MNIKKDSLTWKLFVPLTVLAAIAAGAIGVVVPATIRQNVEREVVENGERVVNQFKVLRKYYTESVVAKLANRPDATVTFDHKGDPNAFPLPATMIHDLGELLSKEGTKLDLYSPLPFPNRKERKLDDFGKSAWEALSANPDQTYTRTEVQDGRTIVRIALADRMQAQACVNCHNTHPLSPKVGWKLGDLRGVLELKTDVTPSYLQAQRLGQWLAAGLVALFIVLSLVLGFFISRHGARLNKSVVSLLKSVYQLSQRDLTVRATVDENVVGTVADSINMLAEETSKVLGEVSRIAGNVERASSQVKGQAEMVKHTADSDRERVAKMTENLVKSVEQMNLIAKLSESTNQAAENATQSTTRALERVNETVKGMENIRETIAETEKRIKRLGERSQEITGIVNLINTISERTHVLSLNAAMQAAIAGDAGRGFAVVAEEVQRLAESSHNATSQIATLISNIQLETNETIATMGRTISQVVAGSDVAQKAGAQMAETQKIAHELGELVQRIALSTMAQNQAVAELKGRVEEIGRGTEHTTRQIEEQAAETQALAEAARRLAATVSQFKLPKGVLSTDTQQPLPITQPIPVTQPIPTGALAAA